ncbi:MAG: helicase HerA domain-containing protein [Phycisphaerales bacterium]
MASILDRLDPPQRLTARSATSGPVLHPGKLIADDGALGDAWTASLRDWGHVIVSGSTGSGKSVAVRVLIEEIAAITGVNILVLDPRNQSAGLLVPQDRADLLERFPLFGMKEPKGLAFEYVAPGSAVLPALPSDLEHLARGRVIVSLKHLDDEHRCDLFARILDAAFTWASRDESETVRLVIAVEEAQLFTRRLAAGTAKAAASRAEAALDRVLREGRKFGLAGIVSSQSIMDFTRDAAAIRQNAATKVFFHNSDREIEYGRDTWTIRANWSAYPPESGSSATRPGAWPAWRCVRRSPRSGT